MGAGKSGCMQKGQGGMERCLGWDAGRWGASPRCHIARGLGRCLPLGKPARSLKSPQCGASADFPELIYLL